MKIVIGVEVKDASIRETSGVAKRTGRPYNLREQAGWADLGKAFPVEVRWLLADGAAPLPVGRYVLDESSVYVDRNGSIQVDLRRLKPVPVAAARTA